MVIADHEAIVEAIASGKPEVAAAALKKHLSGTLSVIDVISAEFPNYIRVFRKSLKFAPGLRPQHKQKRRQHSRWSEGCGLHSAYVGAARQR